MSCLLCFQSIVKFGVLKCEIPKEYCDRILECCNKYLRQEIQESIFQWKYSEKSPFPLCLICLELSEKLSLIDCELQNHVELFVNKVLSSREEIQNSNSAAEGPLLKSKEIRKLQAGNGNLNYKPKTSISNENCVQFSSSTITKLEESNAAEIVDTELIKIEDHSAELSDFGDDFTSPVSPPSPYVTETIECEPAYYVTKPVSKNTLPQLRIKLDRLKFDSNGKIVMPEFPESIKTFGKRRAAILASAAMLKSQTEDEIPIPNKQIQNRRKLFSIKALKKKVRAIRSFSYNKSTHSNSDVEEESNKRPTKRKRTINIKSEEEKETGVSTPKKLQFQCAICNTRFHTSRELDSHSKITEHVTEKHLNCEKCETKFYLHFELQNHIKNVHELTKCVCKACGHESETIEDHRKHKSTVHYKFNCDQCEGSFYPQHRLINHKIDVHGMESPFKCSTCDATFNRQYRLTAHMEEHQESHEIPKRTCNKCGHVSQNYMEHRKHIDRHFVRSKKQKGARKGIPQKRLQCDLCNLTFSPRAALIAHKIRKHGMESPFKCPTCTKSFSRKLQLTKHMKNATHTAQDSPTLTTPVIKPRNKCRKPTTTTCELCSEVFDTKTALRVHKVYVHNFPTTMDKEKPPKGDFLCHDCGQTFTLKPTLDTHIKVKHLKVISFECTKCNKSFANKMSLTKHNRMHQGITYDCEICGKGFYDKSNLVCHTMRIHVQNRRPRKSYTRTPGLPAKEGFIFQDKQDKQKTSSSNESQMETVNNVNNVQINNSTDPYNNNQSYILPHHF